MELRFQRKGLRIFDAAILDEQSTTTTAASGKRRSAAPTPAQQVTLMDLSHNSLTTLLNLSRLVLLTSLDLSHNALTLVNTQAAQNGRQHRGAIGSSSSTSTSKSFVQFPPTLEHLNLSHNQVQSVFPMGSLFRLRSLNLSNNKNLDQQSLAHLPSSGPLEDLDLSGCNITTTESLAHLADGIVHLDVSNNQLATFPDLTAMGRSVEKGNKRPPPSTLRHLHVKSNPIATNPGLKTALAEAFPLLESLNGFPFEVRSVSKQARAPYQHSDPHHDAHQRGRSASARSSRAPKVIDATNVYDDETTGDEGDNIHQHRPSASYTPQFGLDSAATAPRSTLRASHNPLYPSSVNTTFVDINSIKLQEMERLLVELAEREMVMKKKVGTQKLSLAANAKVRTEQDAKLKSLLEIEGELEQELANATAQLHQSQLRKAVSAETLLLERLSYAV